MAPPKEGGAGGARSARRGNHFFKLQLCVPCAHQLGEEQLHVLTRLAALQSKQQGGRGGQAAGAEVGLNPEP